MFRVWPKWSNCMSDSLQNMDITFISLSKTDNIFFSNTTLVKVHVLIFNKYLEIQTSYTNCWLIYNKHFIYSPTFNLNSFILTKKCHLILSSTHFLLYIFLTQKSFEPIACALLPCFWVAFERYSILNIYDFIFSCSPICFYLFFLIYW